MEESSFEIDSSQLAEAVRLFPPQRQAHLASYPACDLGYLAAATPGEGFVRHAWDEGGHL